MDRESITQETQAHRAHPLSAIRALLDAHVPEYELPIAANGNEMPLGSVALLRVVMLQCVTGIRNPHVFRDQLLYNAHFRDFAALPDNAAEDVETDRYERARAELLANDEARRIVCNALSDAKREGWLCDTRLAYDPEFATELGVSPEADSALAVGPLPGTSEGDAAPNVNGYPLLIWAWVFLAVGFLSVLPVAVGHNSIEASVLFLAGILVVIVSATTGMMAMAAYELQPDARAHAAFWLALCVVFLAMVPTCAG